MVVIFSKNEKQQYLVIAAVISFGFSTQVNSQEEIGQIIGLSSTTFVDFLMSPGPRPFFFTGSVGVISPSDVACEPSPSSSIACDLRFLPNFLLLMLLLIE